MVIVKYTNNQTETPINKIYYKYKMKLIYENLAKNRPLIKVLLVFLYSPRENSFKKTICSGQSLS
uniref:Putative ovule protein n=1 Tax=Solanum chacoense TaxID=4108 RepID=A0A0V0I524_SOLCH